ncbi:hypothetical protein GUITHDRAFT_98925 [Guillardia theta CCMP2712]|uniref:SAP domain-containing protein n=2 Tax=Guillardia theta TaxID=55529 RepID=L1K3H9_GUITC|nr:hypothetical protein GUITHDRAFT_98925 [Guillardia theta CCMP2712]EKX55142.1 hypothetical protein GUITHDRAFT_98925 [Guillardia theta CCMP2712]|eukprot:XP_005842122.1 hypothetical protein GUITHDRAFT_98925 [Guillardia theta CCMP2712]
MTLNSNSIRVERRDVSGSRQLTRMDDKEGAEGLQIDSDIYEVPKRVTFVEQKILSQILWEGRITDIPNREDLETMNVLMLRDLCRDLGLVQKGKKVQLIERIDSSRGKWSKEQELKLARMRMREELEANMRTRWELKRDFL